MKRTHQEMSGAAPAPAARPAIVRDDFRKLAVPESVRRGVQQLVLQHVFAGTSYDSNRYLGERPELPGPLAITLSRRTLAFVEAGDYVVCEKSDGERAMLLLLSAPHGAVPSGAYLVNRSFEVSSFEQGIAYASMCAPAGLTLIDGELIFRPTDQGSGTGARVVFNMFDVITANGVAVGGRWFDARMKVIGDTVRAPFRSADDARLAGGKPGLPLYLLGKFFLPKSRIGALLEYIREEGEDAHAHVLTAPLESEMGVTAVATANNSGSSSSCSGGGGRALPQPKRRVYRHDIRVNGTDGIVFTPIRASYLDQFSLPATGCVLPLLKWKFADENTVDFRLRRDDLESGGFGDSAAPASATAVSLRSVPLWLNGGRDRKSGQDIDLNVARTSLSSEACDAYLALFDRLSSDSLVVEAGYDIAESSWRIKRIRDRKTRANHIATGWQTLEVMAENITASELVDKLQGRAGGAPAAVGAGAPSAAAAAGAGGAPPFRQQL